MSNERILVSRPNASALSGDVRDFMLRSDKNILKVAVEGTGMFDISDVSPTDSIDINHNLGYKPIVMYYFKHPQVGTGRYYLAPTRADAGWNLSGHYEHLNDNSVRLNLTGYYNSGSTSLSNIPYKYYILIEPRLDTWFE